MESGSAGTKKSSDPPETDLDYYSRPENYEGSNLTNIKRFNFAKQKEEKSKLDANKKKKKKKDGFDIFKRYRHILKGYLDADIEPDEADTSEEEEELSSKKIKFQEQLVITELKEDESNTLSDKERQKISELSKGDSRPESSESCLSTPKTPSTPTDSGYRTGRDRSHSLTPMEMSSETSSVTGTKRGSTTGRSSVQSKYSILSKEMRARVARENWRKYTRFVIMVKKLTAAASKGGGADMGMKTFTDIASEAETSTKKGGLSFDPNYFKAKKEVNISNEVKSILSLPSEQRTPEQIQTAMFGLQSLRSFAEYPLHMQEKLATVAWFELVPPKRIIIRQGHFAENFYFILSGQAVVTLLLKDPKTGASFVKTATIMRKGMSFGELALLHHSRRTATVTSQGTVQLLTIGRADFFDIFMSGSGPDDIPDHIKFISQCDFMKDWPIEHLLEHPEECLLHFFKRNVVIVKDSTCSEWIYVVKSGFCQVLKQLRGVTPKLGFHSSKRASTMAITVPQLPGIIKEPKIDTGLRRKRRSKTPSKDENEENNPPKEPVEKKQEQKKFSKDEYSKNPTLKGHLAVKRQKKNYVIPEKCRPPKPPQEPKEKVTGKLPPVFVQVEALKPRDAFGLETIEFDNDIERPKTVVSLVSRGAECIMLSKAFFAKHANEKVKKLIRHQVQPYPDDETFQDNLQIKEDWQLYKKSLIATLTTNI